MYRIVETRPGQERLSEVGCFDCPYNALRMLRDAVRRSAGRAWLQLVSPDGVVLVDTSDILGERELGNANPLH